MDDFSLYLSVFLRWMHILAAVTAVGGAFYIRLALLPSLSVLDDRQRQALLDAARSRWAKVVMACIGLLLISGIVNLLMVLRQVTPEFARLYHPIFGVKFLLALAIFFLSSALVGRSAAFDRIRRNARFWMTVNLLLAVLLICLSGVLRFVRDASLRDLGAPRAEVRQTDGLTPRDRAVLSGEAAAGVDIPAVAEPIDEAGDSPAFPE